jgi:hypothetical protein
MAIPAQRSLGLTVAANVSLVTVDVVRGVLGVDAETVVARVDEGRLRWVWDFSSPGSARRELRFWTSELTDGYRPQPVEQVIAAIIGATPGGRQRAAILEQRWCISAQLIMALVRKKCLEEDRVGHTRYLRRPSIEEFLRSRLIQ